MATSQGQLASQRKAREANPVATKTAAMVRDARRRAKNKNVPFEIDLEYVRSIVNDHCPVLGVALDWSCRRSQTPSPIPSSPSLDRIVPDLGYVKGNVWIISHRANTIKSNATHEELKLVTEAVGKAIIDSQALGINT